jgi:hypothetical protein
VGHSRVRIKSLIRSLDLNEAWKREVGSSRECLKVFAMCIECLAELERRGGGDFYSPPRESSLWGVRNLDMSGSGAGHVWPTTLEPDMGSEYIWSRT